MAKQLIKEAYRMQQLAGLINENYVDLGPINSPFMESEEVNETDAGELESKKEEAKRESRNGYGQYVNKTKGGKYYISDYYDRDETMYAYENGKLISDFSYRFKEGSNYADGVEINETLDTREIDKKIQTDKDFLDKVKKATEEAEKGNTSALAALLNPMMKPFKEAEEEDDDMDDVESDEEELDYFSNKPGKKDEFDTEDDIEPTAKDVKATGADNSKQGRLAQLTKKKDAILAKFKAGQITIDQYKTEIGDIPVQIKKLQADIDRDLAIDDEDEI